MKPVLRWIFFVSAGAAAFFLVRHAWACGPYTTTALLGDIGIPDTPLKDFAGGKLGIVRPTFSQENLVIAYRHLEGWGLDEVAQKSVIEAPERDSGGQPPDPEVWRQARTTVMGGEAPKIDPFTQLKEYNSYVRIPAGAFEHAALKIQEISKAHDAKSPEVVEWIKGQDQVFASTVAAPAIPSAVKAPDWLRAERDYQIGAALFYSEKFDDARKAFGTISLDKNSPWQPWGSYLQARCWVREATLKTLPPAGAPAVAPAPPPLLRPYQQAQALLENCLKTKNLPEDVRDAAENYRDLVRHVTEPAKLRDEALVLLSVAKPGLEFRSALMRLQSAEKYMEGGEPVAETHLNARAEGLRIWLDTFKGGAPLTEESSLLKAAKDSTPMLVAALVKTPKDHPDTKALVALAKKVPATSPAYASVQWNLLWLDLGELSPSAQKSKLEASLNDKNLPLWAMNRVRGGRRSLASSLDEWVPFAPSYVVATEVENNVEATKADERTGALPQLFAGVEGNVINQSLTLDQLTAVARHPALMKSMAFEIARCAWMRALVLERMDKATELAPLLEETLRGKAQSIIQIQDPVARRFEAVRLMMDNPGLRFDIGTDYATRVNATDVKDFDSLRDNWWCSPTEEKAKTIEAGPNPGFLKPADLQMALLDRRALAKIPDAQIYFANAVLAFADAHPDDERVPESLHKVVGTTRAPMCGSAEMTTLSKRCFILLHKRYPKNEWTKKTKYYF